MARAPRRGAAGACAAAGPRRSSRLRPLAGEEPQPTSRGGGGRAARALAAAGKGKGQGKGPGRTAGAGAGAAEGAAPAAWASHPMKAREQALKKKGFKTVAGVDEAGRGPLAGPVVAAACIVEDRVDIPEVMDSKQIATEEQREAVFAALEREKGVTFAYAVIDHEEIDRINILQATLRAMEQAVEKLPEPPAYIVVDGNRLPKGFDPATSEAMVKGDAKCYAVAAASIVAKVVRDRIMHELDREYPQYGFKVHKGYGVPAHKAAIFKHGPSPVHRRTFAPVKHML